MEDINDRKTPLEVAKNLFSKKYSDAQCLIVGGSVVRGEGSLYSDLDIVIIYDHLDFAYRDSFLFEGWPIEVFVHDIDTLRYFLDEVDRPSGFPSLAQMIIEGIVVSEKSDDAKIIKKMADDFMQIGPVKWTKEDIDRARYSITDLIEDIRSPKYISDNLGAGASLYEALADFYFRSKNSWSASGKMISRKLNLVDKDLAKLYDDAFIQLYTDNNPDLLIKLTENILAPFDGFLFGGYRLDAPNEWRKPLGD